MANTDNFIKIFVDENTVQVTDTAFSFTVYAFTRSKNGGTFSTNVTVTIDPLANDATNLAAIKTQVTAILNTAGLGRTFTTTNCSVWGQFN